MLYDLAPELGILDLNSQNLRLTLNPKPRTPCWVPLLRAVRPHRFPGLFTWCPTRQGLSQNYGYLLGDPKSVLRSPYFGKLPKLWLWSAVWGGFRMLTRTKLCHWAMFGRSHHFSNRRCPYVTPMQISCNSTLPKAKPIHPKNPQLEIQLWPGLKRKQKRQLYSTCSWRCKLPTIPMNDPYRAPYYPHNLYNPHYQ